MFSVTHRPPSGLVVSNHPQATIKRAPEEPRRSLADLFGGNVGGGNVGGPSSAPAAKPQHRSLASLFPAASGGIAADTAAASSAAADGLSPAAAAQQNTSGDLDADGAAVRAFAEPVSPSLAQQVLQHEPDCTLVTMCHLAILPLLRQPRSPLHRWCRHGSAQCGSWRSRSRTAPAVPRRAAPVPSKVPQVPAGVQRKPLMTHCSRQGERYKSHRRLWVRDAACDSGSRSPARGCRQQNERRRRQRQEAARQRRSLAAAAAPWIRTSGSR